MADGCSFSVVPPDVGKLITGILSSFKQIETEWDISEDRLYPELKPIFFEVVKCWTAKVCENEYQKENALEDAQDATDEVVDNATKKMKTAIDNVIHEAAKYRIPKILSDLSATRSYDNSCAQLLMCDVFEQVRNIDLEGIVNDASKQKLQNVKSYADIVRDIADTNVRQFDVAIRAYLNKQDEKNEEHSISSKALTEVPVIAILSSMMALILSEIYEPFYSDLNSQYQGALSDCASQSWDDGGFF